MPGRLVRLARKGAASGFLERAGRLARQIGRRGAVELGEQRRGMVEVVCADLEQLVAGSLAQPLGEAGVVLRAGRFRQARVGDVANEYVLEAIRGLVLERRARLSDDQVAEQEVVDRLVDALAAREVFDRAGPEGATDHGGPLEHLLRDAVEPVDTRRDQRLHRVGDLLRCALLAALGDVEHDLLEEEGIAARLVEECALRPGGDRPVLGQRLDQRRAVGLAERLELDRRRADAASAPVRAHVE